MSLTLLQVGRNGQLSEHSAVGRAQTVELSQDKKTVQRNIDKTSRVSLSGSRFRFGILLYFDDLKPSAKVFEDRCFSTVSSGP